MGGNLMGTAAADLLTYLTRLGIEMVAHGDRLRYRPRSALTPDLAERLRAHKAEVLAILRPAEGPGGATAAQAVDHPERVVSRPEATPEVMRWEDCIDPPEPCPRCGGLILWWNAFGDRRCLTCDPPLKAIRALERVERIRRRHGIPNPAGAADLLADLKRLGHTCSGAQHRV